MYTPDFDKSRTKQKSPSPNRTGGLDVSLFVRHKYDLCALNSPDRFRNLFRNLASRRIRLLFQNSKHGHLCHFEGGHICNE